MRMKLPEIKPVTPSPQQSGPVVVGGVEPADEAVPVGLGATEDISTLDVKPAVTEPSAASSQQTQQPVSVKLSNYEPLSPQLSSDNIAHVEELARSIVEVRAIAVNASSKLETWTLHVPAFIQQEIRGVLATVNAAQSLAQKALDEAVALRGLPQRLNSIDAVLESRGLPTSQSAPTVKLTQMRRLVHPARVIDGVVTLFYNPRQGENGAVDPQDFQLSRDNVRKVWCGYRLEIPAGYIADVFVGNDLISSMSGRRDSEEILSLRTNGTNLTISSGQPIARLLLRKVEAAALEIEVQK